MRVPLPRICAALLLVSCASPSAEHAEQGEQAEHADQVEHAGQGEHESAAQAAEREQADLDLLDEGPDVAAPDAQVLMVTPPSGRSLAPAGLRPKGVVVFAPFGAPPGLSAEKHAQVQALLVERYYGDPGEQRLAEIDAELGGFHVAMLTPAWINLLIGLDMGQADDVELGGRVCSDWYVRQIRYKQVILPASPDKLDERSVTNRLLVVDGWRHWWERTAEDPAKVERYRKRIDTLIWERARVGR